MSNRVKGRGCRLCNNERQTSFPEQAIFYYLKQIFEDTSNRTVLKEVTSEMFKSGVEIDIYIPSLLCAFEYDGYLSHRSEKAEKREKEKNKLLFKSGISLIRIRDQKLLENEHNNTLIVYHNYETPSSIRDTLLELRDVLLANINLSKKQNEDLQRWESISLETDTPAILASFKDNIKTRSVASFDWLMKEWHPILNERLSPEVIHRGSGKNVWWLCEDGHNFLMTPNKRTTPANKRNCPFCKSLIDISKSLTAMHPEIGKLWHPTKNGTLLPDKVAASSTSKVFWLLDESTVLCESPANMVKRAEGEMLSTQFGL